MAYNLKPCRHPRCDCSTWDLQTEERESLQAQASDLRSPCQLTFGSCASPAVFGPYNLQSEQKCARIPILRDSPKAFIHHSFFVCFLRIETKACLEMCRGNCRYVRNESETVSESEPSLQQAQQLQFPIARTACQRTRN